MKQTKTLYDFDNEFEEMTREPYKWHDDRSYNSTDEVCAYCKWYARGSHEEPCVECHCGHSAFERITEETE